MSERTRGSSTHGAQHEVHDLTDLHASKTQEALRNAASGAANTDLSSASIQSISVVRLSARPEKRNLSSLTVPTAAELEPTTEHRPKQSGVVKKGQTLGILKNPYFPYKGNILERFITLLANILKYLERSLLASLRPQPPQVRPPTSTTRAKKRDAAGREIDEDVKDSDTKGRFPEMG